MPTLEDNNQATTQEKSVAQQTSEGIEVRSKWIISHGAYENLNRYAAEIARLKTDTSITPEAKEKKEKLLAFMFFFEHCYKFNQKENTVEVGLDPNIAQYFSKIGFSPEGKLEQQIKELQGKRREIESAINFRAKILGDEYKVANGAKIRKENSKEFQTIEDAKRATAKKEEELRGKIGEIDPIYLKQFNQLVALSQANDMLPKEWSTTVSLATRADTKYPGANSRNQNWPAHEIKRAGHATSLHAMSIAENGSTIDDLNKQFDFIFNTLNNGDRIIQVIDWEDASSIQYTNTDSLKFLQVEDNNGVTHTKVTTKDTDEKATTDQHAIAAAKATLRYSSTYDPKNKQLTITNKETGESKQFKVIHFQVKDNTPFSPNFAEIEELNNTKNLNTIVHCATGVGRTGQAILMQMLWEDQDALKIAEELLQGNLDSQGITERLNKLYDITFEKLKIRQYRVFVQTEKQIDAAMKSVITYKMRELINERYPGMSPENQEIIAYFAYKDWRSFLDQNSVPFLSINESTKSISTANNNRADGKKIPDAVEAISAFTNSLKHWATIPDYKSITAYWPAYKQVTADIVQLNNYAVKKLTDDNNPNIERQTKMVNHLIKIYREELNYIINNPGTSQEEKINGIKNLNQKVMGKFINPYADKVWDEIQNNNQLKNLTDRYQFTSNDLRQSYKNNIDFTKLQNVIDDFAPLNDKDDLAKKIFQLERIAEQKVASGEMTRSNYRKFHHELSNLQNVEKSWQYNIGYPLRLNATAESPVNTLRTPGAVIDYLTEFMKKEKGESTAAFAIKTPFRFAAGVSLAAGYGAQMLVDATVAVGDSIARGFKGGFHIREESSPTTMAFRNAASFVFKIAAGAAEALPFVVEKGIAAIGGGTKTEKPTQSTTAPPKAASTQTMTSKDMRSDPQSLQQRKSPVHNAVQLNSKNQTKLKTPSTDDIPHQGQSLTHSTTSASQHRSSEPLNSPPPANSTTNTLSKLNENGRKNETHATHEEVRKGYEGRFESLKTSLHSTIDAYVNSITPETFDPESDKILKSLKYFSNPLFNSTANSLWHDFNLDSFTENRPQMTVSITKRLKIEMVTHGSNALAQKIGASNLSQDKKSELIQKINDETRNALTSLDNSLKTSRDDGTTISDKYIEELQKTNRSYLTQPATNAPAADDAPATTPFTPTTPHP